MNYAIHRFSLDINKDEPSQVILSAKRGDTAKLLIISLLADKHDYVIDKDSYATLTGKKQNGVTFEHGCVIDLKNNKIEYSFESSTVSSTGKIDCELNLFNELGERLTTSRFTIIVHETIFSADISDAEDDISALTQLRSELNALLQTVQKKLDNGEFVGEKGEQGIQGEKGEKGEKGDPPVLETEDWTFTLEDGTTITKRVALL